MFVMFRTKGKRKIESKIEFSIAVILILGLICLLIDNNYLFFKLKLLTLKQTA